MTEEKKNFVEKIADSKFMHKLEDISMKLSSSQLFSAISGGMGGTMGLLMTGTVFQIICVIGSSFFGWDTAGELYNFFYTPYRWTMGILAFFMTYCIAASYSKVLGVNQMMSGFTAMACYFMVCSPLTEMDGNYYIDIASMGSTNLFVALIIGLVCARIMKFAQDKDLRIKLPDSVPEGIGNSFKAIIPMGMCIIFWYVLAYAIAKFTNTTLSYLIIGLLSIPMNILISTPGMFVIMLLAQIFWFFGIHGSAVVFAVILIPWYQAYMTNASLAAAGQALVYSPMFLYGAISVWGGTGNTLPLVLMGLKSKSKTIKAVSKAALVPNICNINEPVIFGMPIMYNATLFIPFLLQPVVCGILYLIAYKLELIAYPQVLIMTTLPVLIATFLSTLDIKNVIFNILLFPVCFLIWYPFFKVYEKQMCEKEAEMEQEEAEQVEAA